MAGGGGAHSLQFLDIGTLIRPILFEIFYHQNTPPQIRRKTISAIIRNACSIPENIPVLLPVLTSLI